jgi:hypothetical protein
MNPWLQLWNVVFGLFEKSYKAMLALLFISAVALFAPAASADAWVQSHRVLEWGCLLFSLFYLVVLFLETIARRLLLLRYFRDLPEDERRVLFSFMHGDGQRTVSLISGTETACALVRMGILAEVRRAP